MVIQRINKKGVQFQRAFYSVLAFSAVIISIGIIMGEWSKAYDVSNPSDLANLNKLDSLSEDINKQRGRLSSSDPDPGEDAEANTFRGVYGVIANIFAPFKAVFGSAGLIDNISERFGLPDFTREIVISFIFVAFTYGLISIIFRLGRPA